MRCIKLLLNSSRRSLISSRTIITTMPQSQANSITYSPLGYSEQISSQCLQESSKPMVIDLLTIIYIKK